MIDKFSANCGFKDFLENPINQETITDALTLSNKKLKSNDCLFPKSFLGLDGYTIPNETDFDWNYNTHPALHSTAFARNTVIFDQNKYILFGKSLIHHGQPFYACLITSIFFELRILFEFSYEKKEEQEK